LYRAFVNARVTLGGSARISRHTVSMLDEGRWISRDAS